MSIGRSEYSNRIVHESAKPRGELVAIIGGQRAGTPKARAFTQPMRRRRNAVVHQLFPPKSTIPATIDTNQKRGFMQVFGHARRAKTSL
jgi:hypothetical protein